MVFKGSSDTRPMNWEFNDNFVNVKGGTGSGGWLTTYFENIQSVSVEFDTYGNVVDFRRPTALTEYALHFPPAIPQPGMPAPQLSSLRIWESVATVLVSGIASVAIGPAPALTNGSIVPFDSVQGLSLIHI